MNQPVKPLVRQYVSDFIMIGLFVIFFIVIIVVCFIGWNQIVYHSADSTNYASESMGVLNNIIVYCLGIFSGVVGVLFNIKPDEQRKNIDQSVKVSKEVGMVYMVEQKEESVPEQDD